MLATRRQFFRNAMSLGVASSAFPLLSGCSSTREAGAPATGLVPDPQGLLDLPPGFSYRVISPAGELMSDGLRVPHSHDGMACFAIEGDEDRCILVRNHELDPDEAHVGPYADVQQVSEEVLAHSYDLGRDGLPLPGGTTTLIYNMRTGEVERSHLSLSGTLRNCSGGMTPWGSWLTCEETLDRAGRETIKDHGYVFEVPANTSGLAEPVALTAMGRFNHEATATDPRTGIVYQTEDEDESLIYRFIPDVPGELERGGRLQVMAIKGMTMADTRNWDQAGAFPQGASWQVEWLDIEDVHNPNNDIAQRGHQAGAALFARGEGMCFAVEQTGSAIFFACTTGGYNRYGQIWKYVPADAEGMADEQAHPGTLTLHYESQSAGVMDMCDNIVGAPWGDLVVCEDSPEDNFVRGVTPDGQVYSICRNAHAEKGEFAGACFSPDGETLFVNAQGPHVTFAITGPWARLVRA